MTYLEHDVQCIGSKVLQKLVKVLGIDTPVLGVFLKDRSREDAKGDLGIFIRTQRRKLGLSSRMLARKVGKTRAWMSYVELGVISLVESDDMITKLSRVLKVEREVLASLQPKKRKLKSKIVTEGTLAELLFCTRMDLGITQREMAQQIGVSNTTVSCIENEDECISVHMLNKVRHALALMKVGNPVSTASELSPAEG